MKISEVELPSNKKFGLFFTFVFAVCAVFFFIYENMIWAYTFISTSSLLLVITLLKENLLLGLNKLWMRIGFLLGMIVSPIILGIIFFGLVTPYGVVMRMFGRDELRLKTTNKLSHWIIRSEPIEPDSFKRQF